MKRFLSYFNKPSVNSKIASAAVTFFLLVLYLVYLPATPYEVQKYDAAGYWETAKTFHVNGSFQLYGFTAVLRGYLLPLLYYPFLLISESLNLKPLFFTRITGAIQAALLFGYVLPALWEAVTNSGKIHWLRRLFFALIGFALWRDYFNFSLSDFPAILAVSGGLLLLLQRPGFIKALFAGCLLAAAISFRPVYMVLMPVFLLAAFFGGKPGKKWYVFLKPVMLCAGFFLVSLPQLLVNVKHYNNYSLFAPSEYDGKNLYLAQLNWGLITQKYETNYGQDYPEAAMIFIDPVGLEIQKKEKADDLQTYGAYLDLVWHYPVDFAGMYFRHFFNGLDLQYASPYPIRASKIYWPVLLLNYTVLFLALFLIFLKNDTVLTVPRMVVLLAVLLPSLVVIPTAIEPRFMLPLHLFFYAIVCFGFPVNRHRTQLTIGFKVKFISFYLFFMAGCFALSSATQVHLEMEPRLFGKGRETKQETYGGWK